MNFSLGQLLFLLILIILLFGDISKITRNISKSIKLFKDHFNSLEKDVKKQNKKLK